MRPRVHNFRVRRYSGAVIRILSGVRSSTPSPREGAVLVRERARRTVRVEAREAHRLARSLNLYRSLICVKLSEYDYCAD